VPLSKIKRLPKGVGPAEAMKYVVTGGLTAFDEQLDLFDEATLAEIEKPIL
jgi:hypothetical protein